MKNWVKKLTRYIKLPFKFIYWIVEIFFFIFSLFFIYFKKKQNYYWSRRYEQSVLCVSHVSICFDGRIKKCANQIIKLGTSVILIKPYDVQEDEKFEYSGLNNKVKIKRLGLSGSFSHFPRVLDICMIIYMIVCKCRFIHCHDINTAFMGLLVCKITGKILISDLHEWKSETNNLDQKEHNFLQKRIFKLIEDLIVKESDFVITVNERIANALKATSKNEREILIVKNCPESAELQNYNLRLKLNIPKEYLIGYYIGQMAPYRNFIPLIKAIRYFPKICLVFQGTIDSSYFQILKDTCKKQNVYDRVFFLPPTQHDLIPSSCQGADFGIFSCSLSSQSMYSALPNKLFEYIAGGIPILSEDIPLMREYIEKYNIGTMFQSNNFETFEKSFKFILDKDNLEKMKKNIISLRKKLIDETNKDNLSVYTKIYGGVLIS